MIMKRLVTAAAALIAVLYVSTVHAALLYVSQTGSNTGDCTNPAAPCYSITYAASVAAFSGEEIACVGNGEVGGGAITKSVTVDCNGTMADVGPLTIDGSGITVVLRNFSMFDLFDAGVTVTNGNLVMDNVHIRTISPASALQVGPSAPSKVVVKNCIFDDNQSGVLIKPAAGGSVSAEFDHVTIAANSGGGIKTDTTNGPVTLEIADSVIKDNGGNGINAVGGAGGQNIVSIDSSVIAENGAAGVQSNGVNAGVLLAATLLDQNAAGALSVVSGGNMFTYGNNRIVGSMGSAFTSTASLK
jgi:Right handed beta helix region